MQPEQEVHFPDLTIPKLPNLTIAKRFLEEAQKQREKDMAEEHEKYYSGQPEVKFEAPDLIFLHSYFHQPISLFSEPTSKANYEMRGEAIEPISFNCHVLTHITPMPIMRNLTDVKN